MLVDNIVDRRLLVSGALAGIVAANIVSEARAEISPNSQMAIKQVKAGVLDVGYHETGPRDGSPVLLLHGWPYDIHSYSDVAPLLASRGCRVIVPHLRGHGTTRFIDDDTPRSGQQAALGADVIALMDALGIARAVLAGFDWGGRAACVAAALWPERCSGLVSVNSYLIQDIAKAAIPVAAQTEAGFFGGAWTSRPNRKPARHRETVVDAKFAHLEIRRWDILSQCGVL